MNLCNVHIFGVVPSGMGGQRRPRPTMFVQYFPIFFQHSKYIFYIQFLFVKFVLGLFWGGFFIVFYCVYFMLYFCLQNYIICILGCGYCVGVGTVPRAPTRTTKNGTKTRGRNWTRKLRGFLSLVLFLYLFFF